MQSNVVEESWQGTIQLLELSDRQRDWLRLIGEVLLKQSKPNPTKVGISLRHSVDAGIGFPLWRSVVDALCGPQDLGGLLREWRTFETKHAEPIFPKNWTVTQGSAGVEQIEDPKLYFVWSRLSSKAITIEKLCAMTGLGTKTTRLYVERLFRSEMVNVQMSPLN